MLTMPMNEGYGKPVLQDISRQRKLAETLRQQSAEQLNGQMVSGHYVAPSWTQQLARALNPVVGAYVDKKADESEKGYNDTKNQKFADILKNMNPQQVQNGTTQPMQAPERTFDQFGSPTQGQDLTPQPQGAPVPNMQMETPQQQMQRVQPEVLQYMQQYKNTPEAQYMLAQLGKQDDRAYAQGQKVDDRQYSDTREEKLYTRNRGDQVADREDNQEFQRIQMKEQQGFQLTLQEKQFSQQHQMQQAGFGHAEAMQGRALGAAAEQGRLSRAQQDKLANVKGAPSGYQWNVDGSLSAIKGGPADAKVDVVPKLQEGERKAATLLSRLKNSKAQLDAALVKSPNAAKPELTSAGIRALTFGQGEALANYSTSQDRQKVESAQLDMLDAALTLGTGAAYTKEQLEGYRKSYFPQLGDKKEAVADKQLRLTNIIKAAEIAAGRAADLVPDPPAPSGATGGWSITPVNP